MATTGQAGRLPVPPPRPDPTTSRRSLQFQSFGLLPRTGPQLPIVIEVDGQSILRHPRSGLDPDAPAFLPAGPDLVDRELATSPQSWEALFANTAADREAEVPVVPPPPPCSCHGRSQGSCPIFIARFVNIVSEVRSFGKPNMDGARRVLLDRTIDPAPWRSLLQGYFDADELVAGLAYGWDFSVAPDADPRDAPENLPTARQFPESVDAYLEKELQYGSITGPLPADLPWPVTRNPIGSVPKPPTNKRRIIIDCSQGERGINRWIRHDFHRGRSIKTSLPGTEQIVAAILKVRLLFPGEEVQLFKMDFSRYYRLFLICPSQSPFMCIMWRGEVYADRSWSFGNRGACASSQRFSEAVAWLFRTRLPPRPGAVNSGLACRCSGPCQCGDNHMSSYIDDSVAIAAASNAVWLYNSFLELISKLTLQLSSTPGHISPPAPVCIALGVEYDTVHNMVSLSDEKLEKLVAMLEEWTAKTEATPREIASLAGRLLWACCCVPPGRVFLGRVLAFKREADARGPALARRPVQLDAQFHLDIQWWLSMVANWNGKSFLSPTWSGDVSLDASSDGWYGHQPGLGAFNLANGEYLACGVPPAFSHFTIADLELLVHIVSVRVWGHLWDSSEINILTDNESCRWLLRNGRSRDPVRLAMARTLVGLQFSGNFRLVSARVSTKENLLADRLSRLGTNGMWESFQAECAAFGVRPRRVPVLPEHFFFGS